MVTKYNNLVIWRHGEVAPEAKQFVWVIAVLV